MYSMGDMRLRIRAIAGMDGNAMRLTRLRGERRCVWESIFRQHMIIEGRNRDTPGSQCSIPSGPREGVISSVGFRRRISSRSVECTRPDRLKEASENGFLPPLTVAAQELGNLVKHVSGERQIRLSGNAERREIAPAEFRKSRGGNHDRVVG